MVRGENKRETRRGGRLAALALGALLAAVVAAGAPGAGATAYTCSGGQVKLLDTWNVYGVENGGKPSAFSTNGQAYCVASIATYHWNNGVGKAPGTISLMTAGHTLGPYKAKGSSGQSGAKNVNWTVTLSTTTNPVVIDGTYTCVDSDPATWSQNQQSHGDGFCQVWGVPATPASGGGATTAPPTTSSAKKSSPKKSGSGGKVSLTAKPDTGDPPLTVTFSIGSPKAVGWRIDFGDGQTAFHGGTPPKSTTHRYKVRGDYRARLTVLTQAPYRTAYDTKTATANVAVGTALMRFAAHPAAGSPPLRVTFDLGTSVKNVATWSIAFGDGTLTGGPGKPPASTAHTYAKAGTYVATFVVKPGANSAVIAYAQVVVGGGTPPTMSLTASPTSGKHPLAVTFHLGVNIPGRIVSWRLAFGDGQQSGGTGKPPATVRHTYARAGTFLAFLAVAQQQAYGGPQYVVPKTGLAVVVR